jgi:hypothetical protein
LVSVSRFGASHGSEKVWASKKTTSAICLERALAALVVNTQPMDSDKPHHISYKPILH